MWFNVEYNDKYGLFHFNPFIKDSIRAKSMYLNCVWSGCKSVRIITDSWSEEKTIWETPVPVFPSYNNDNPTDDLPF